ncbi:mCG147458 [Mus musculus]|nr:mCG147458 [Mus musculus]
MRSLLSPCPSVGTIPASSHSQASTGFLLAADTPLTFCFFHFRNSHRNLEKKSCQFL